MVKLILSALNPKKPELEWESKLEFYRILADISE